ncbi:Transmembrane_domain-containing protein [Hexamita inflata]|uniref:Transmembrane domain-containing protein n=1 Tax=Hexamita inflata TaxID=28002 RepID=A0AA86R393_9EUKA|nr:Transmembrane domain-containing protein [Hexamita inflata]
MKRFLIIPHSSPQLKIFGGLINCVIPGSGLILLSKFEPIRRRKVVAIGLFQLILATIVVGYFWGIMNGIAIMNSCFVHPDNTKQEKLTRQKFTNIKNTRKRNDQTTKMVNTGVIAEEV